MPLAEAAAGGAPGSLLLLLAPFGSAVDLCSLEARLLETPVTLPIIFRAPLLYLLLLLQLSLLSPFHGLFWLLLLLLLVAGAFP